MMNTVNTRIRSFANEAHRTAATVHADVNVSSIEAQIITGYMLGALALGADGFYAQLKPRAKSSSDKAFYAHWAIDGKGEIKVYAAVRQDYLDAQTSDHAAAVDTLKFARAIVETDEKTLSLNVQKQLRAIGVIVGLTDSDFPEQWGQKGYKPSTAKATDVLDALEENISKLLNADGQREIIEEVKRAARDRARKAANPDAPARVRVNNAAD